ncbi:alpha-beta hydrolase superfamily lysophospholipase [Microbacterium halimionae]|uniref:Alpha-beta hydrolase superfamily lysophospholipase n=1 Tax=Microbacterium halimionae TaxID=1526413 RepID=A0A7W3PKJ8_9MICO|nr:alpha/beta fold hydrolase [Microbacterium halimionae]MBA8815188.1 alpha-beta hydrolase superfamily lysophospholipase [Microbacterium halimionae]NII94021.1 alpha-beta hydrolase superfamily lysophospholipase [Microbacterium halimionae]
MPEFIDAHGVAIVYDVYPAATTPRGVVQLLHGVGEHAGRYSSVISALTADGFIVYADDHRGHGRTGIRQHDGDMSKLGRLGVGGHRAAVNAEWQLTEIIRTDTPDLPLILLGHSWGSFLAQILVNSHPGAYDGLVLSGSALLWPGSLNSGDLNAPWAGSDANGVEWLSTDIDVQQDFLDDPLTTTTPLAKLFGMREAARMLGRPRKNLGRNIPLLLMVGRDDTVGGPRSVHKLAAAYRERSKLTDITTLVYPETRHEIFNDKTQGEVRADLRAWLDMRFPARNA